MMNVLVEALKVQVPIVSANAHPDSSKKSNTPSLFMAQILPWILREGVRLAPVYVLPIPAL
jgi:hypothetical protein